MSTIPENLKTAYHWHPDTRVYVGASLEPESPEEPGVFYPPGPDATFEEPPAAGGNKAARRLADNSGWEIVADLRGVDYWLVDGSKHVVSGVGEELPEGALSEPPPPTDAALWLLAQSWAAGELKRNDAVLLRCLKAGVAYPAEWQAYDAALRAIVRAESGDADAKPQRPAYPAGT